MGVGVDGCAAGVGVDEGLELVRVAVNWAQQSEPSFQVPSKLLQVVTVHLKPPLCPVVSCHVPLTVLPETVPDSVSGLL